MWEEGRVCTLDKALYGALQSAKLFWEKLARFLVNDLGFMVNPYDSCVANKTINNKQFTVAWYVDDLKLSHEDELVVEEVFSKLHAEFSKESLLTVRRGKVHEYLGMIIDFTVDGKVSFTMPDLTEEILKQFPDHLSSGPSTTPVANQLFQTKDNAESLSTTDAELYHCMTAQLQYRCKRVQPHLQTAVSFLLTRAQRPDIDDFKKLGRCVRYLKRTRHYPLTLEAASMGTIKWWNDASYAVHPDMRSHTGGTLSMGKGSVYLLSTKQKLNTRSSTEAEVVGTNDALGMILWTQHFLEAS